MFYIVSIFLALFQPKFSLEKEVFSSLFQGQIHSATTFVTEHSKNQELFFEDCDVEINDDDTRAFKRKVHTPIKGFLGLCTSYSAIAEGLYKFKYSSLENKIHPPLLLFILLKVFRI